MATKYGHPTGRCPRICRSYLNIKAKKFKVFLRRVCEIVVKDAE